MNNSLFPEEEKTASQKQTIGKTDITYIQASSILTESKGFLDGYDYSLNPYSGCSFGCNYCYAAFFATTQDQKENWGYWVKVKENALQLLKKFRKKKLSDKTIYLSSVTDPYQPIEKTIQLTRSILQELLDYHQIKLVIQTRSPLVANDIDILKQFDHVQINVTITTDSEEVRKVYEPLCPSNKVRLKAATKINEAGLNTCITMTPLLPIADAEAFAKSLVATGVNHFIVQPFHTSKGKFASSTREQSLIINKKYNWDNAKYLETLDVLKAHLPHLGEGKEGFKPIFW